METKEKKKITKKNIKKWIKKNAPIICVSIAAFVLLVFVLLLMLQAEEELEQYEIKNEKLYTYSLNHRLDFYTEVTLDNKNNVTKMIYNGEEITLYTEPIYYVDKEVAIFPNRMTVVFPLNLRKQYKLNRYTRVNGESVQVILQNENLEYGLNNSFVYDGDDVYFFVEDGVIKFGDKSVEVSKFSFVRCEYRGSLSIYNYETDTMTYEEKVTDNVIATFDTYSVNLSVDSITVNNEPSLIDKNIEIMEVLKK